MVDKYKNWKTTSAFVIFLMCFIYAVYKENPNLAEVTGFIVLITWALLKASSDTFGIVLSNLSEALKNKWSK